jgi:hypothetical protein
MVRIVESSSAMQILVGLDDLPARPETVVLEIASEGIATLSHPVGWSASGSPAMMERVFSRLTVAIRQ